MSSIEEKRESFISLAESRTNKAMDTIKLIGNLSNRSYYDYTPDQVNAIFSALQSELTTQKKKYDLALNKKRKFRL